MIPEAIFKLLKQALEAIESGDLNQTVTLISPLIQRYSEQQVFIFTLKDRFEK